MNGAPWNAAAAPQALNQIVPRATYRLQLRREFNFRHARSALPYLAGLGISHLYLSPIFAARSGSAYGYDVVDHCAINPELGTPEEFRSLAVDARKHGLGIVLDIVPNHTAIAPNGNRWWLDVVENGPAARFADYFDIDWTPVRESMRNRLLLPLLENRLGAELSSGKIRVEFDVQHGSFHVAYGDHRLPLDPQTYPIILSRAAAAAAAAADADADEQDFASIVDHFGRLPSRCDNAPDSIDRRHRDKEALKRRLAELCARNADFVARIDNALAVTNGRADDPESLDALERLLSAQPFRLAYWKVAGDEINYRRFFDVNQLAALRVENPEVYAATHELIFSLAR
jgi:(1->4)-alpha-D-glucan 1-alpha-D-glucosylmutase